MGKVLYLGSDASHYKTAKEVLTLPLVKVIARPFESLEVRQVFESLEDFTHIIFGSKSSVTIFFNYLYRSGHDLEDLEKVYLIAVGAVPAHYLKKEGVNPTYISADETGEGVIRVLSSIDLSKANVLLPKSSSVRPALHHFLVEHEVKHQLFVLYDLYEDHPKKLPSLDEIDEIVFTSPKTVDSFFHLYSDLPDRIDLHPLGYMTREHLRKKLLTLQQPLSQGYFSTHD